MELVKESYEEPGTYLQIPPDDARENTHLFTGHEQKYFDIILQRPSSRRGRESSECEARKEIHRRESCAGRLLPTRALRGRGNHPPSQKGYMHFRYYAGSIGRFSKPDNVTGNAMNPQDWNLYSYVHGNPINFNDPTGHGIAGKPEDKIQDPAFSCGMPGTPDDAPNDQDDSSQSGTSQSDTSVSTDTTTPENNQTSQQTSTPENSQNSQQTSTQQTLEAQQQEQQVPLIVGGRKGGRQGKGERGKTARPDGTPNPGKKAKLRKDGRYEMKDPHTGKSKLKPKGWKPTMKDFQELGDKILDFAKEHPVETGAIVATALIFVVPMAPAAAAPVLVVAP